jgi:hypothetical protein
MLTHPKFERLQRIGEVSLLAIGRAVARWLAVNVGQILLFSLSIFGIWYLVIWLQQYYVVASDTVVITLLSVRGEKVDIDKLIISAEKKSNARDILRVQASFKDDATGTFRIILSSDFTRNYDHSSSLGVSYRPDFVSDGSRYFDYELKPDTKVHNLFEAFDGPIFSQTAPEQDLSFYVYPQDKEIPFELWIRDIHGTSIRDAFPNPAWSSDYAIRFVAIPESSLVPGRPWNLVYFNAVDRHANHKRNYILLLGGIIIGVFSAFSTRVVFNLVEYAERETRRVFRVGRVLSVRRFRNTAASGPVQV